MRLPILITFVLPVVVFSGDDWGYHEHNGPHNWEKTCQEGHRQSPIDIRASDVDYALLHRMHFIHYDHAGPVNVTNNGHTVSVNGFEKWDSKQPWIQGGGLKHKYKLAQFHLHWSQHDHTGSEHTMGGLHYPAELHLVHIRSDLTIGEALKKPDGLAVVGVFLVVAHDSAPMSSISSVLDKVVYPGNYTMVQGFRNRHMLPANTEAFYRYEGSLTTPGCNEAVIWTVLAEPISITRSQMKELRQLHELEGSQVVHNYRPVQRLNGRKILYRPASFDKSLLCSLSPPISFISLLTIISNLSLW